MTKANPHAAHYSEKNFWKKLKNYAHKAGHEVVEKALWLYYGAKDPKTPTWAKTVMIGALGYFIFPFDVIPDMLPGAGYTDDLGMLVAAIGTVALHISDETKQRATEKQRQWFGEKKPSVAEGEKT